MKILKVLICFALVPAIGFGQRKEKSALFETVTGDTIRGSFSDPGRSRARTSVRLKRSSDGIMQEFKIAELRSIKVDNGERYLISNVKLDVTPTEINASFLDPAKIKFTVSPLLLLTEFSGSGYQLYSYQTEDRIHLFLQYKDEQPVELIYRQLIFTANAANYENEDRTYIAQLDNIFSSCKFMEFKTVNLRYTITAVVNYLKLYAENCGDHLPVYSNKKNAINRVQVTVKAGVSFGELRVNGTKYPYLNRNLLLINNPVKYDPSPNFGLEGYFNFPRTKNKFGILFAAFYIKEKGQESEYYNYINAVTNTVKTLVINHSSLHFNLLLRYHFTNTALRPFIESGLAINYIIQHKDAIVMDDYYLSRHDVTRNDNPYSEFTFNNFQAGFELGAGLIYKRFSVEYKYLNVSPFASNNTATAGSIPQVLQLGYWLKKN